VTVVRIAWRRSGVSRLRANPDGARRSHLNIFRGTTAFFTLGVIAASTASGLTAQADIANWSFYKGAAFVKSSHSRDEGGMVGIFDVEVRRTMTAMDQKDMICDYQAQVRMTLPNGHAYTDNSPVHNGCNQRAVPAWFRFREYGTRSNHDSYPRGSVFEGSWRDNFTGGEFKKIGEQKL
jgi:hypothetical protein